MSDEYLKNNYVYYINHQYKYIWYLVPKVGSRSLLYWLLSEEYLSKHKDGNLNENFKNISSEYHHKYHTFSFCRNPFDRLVSVYFDKILLTVPLMNPKNKRTKLEFYERWKDKSFKEFANDVCDMPNKNITDNHLLPQIYFIPENIDFLGRFENLQNDFVSVTKKLFEKQFDNRKWNVSQHDHYSEYYDKNLKDKVYQKYKKDFKRFEYE